jgi:hypothetical protein
MRRVLTSIAVAGLLAIAAGTASSQPMTGPGSFVHRSAPGMAGQDWVHGDPAGYLGGLKLALGITAAQEPAWQQYADMVKGVAWQMQRVHEMMDGAIDTANPRERRDMLGRMSLARRRAFDTVHEAAEELLAALDPVQRNKAADSLPGLANPTYGIMERTASGLRTP